MLVFWNGTYQLHTMAKHFMHSAFKTSCLYQNTCIWNSANKYSGLLFSFDCYFSQQYLRTEIPRSFMNVIIALRE
jgi:hypothetical protein